MRVCVLLHAFLYFFLNLTFTFYSTLTSTNQSTRSPIDVGEEKMKIFYFTTLCPHPPLLTDVMCCLPVLWVKIELRLLFYL